MGAGGEDTSGDGEAGDEAAIAELIAAWSKSERACALPSWPMLAALPEVIAFLRSASDPVARRVLDYVFNGLDLRPELVFGIEGYDDDLYLVAKYLLSLEEPPRRLSELAASYVRHLDLRLRGDPLDFRRSVDRLLAGYRADPGPPAIAHDHESTWRPALESTEPADAIGHVEGPMIVFAGPGTGKTHVIEMRVRHLIEGVGIAPESIACVTFTNAAATQLTIRIRRSLEHRGDADDLLSRLRIGTIHSFCYSLVREHQHRAVFMRGAFTPASARDQILFLAREQRSIGISDLYEGWRRVREHRAALRGRTERHDFLSDVAQIFNHVSEEVLGARPAVQARYHQILLGEGASVEARIVRCYPAYWRSMIDAGLMDQSMILSYTECLLRDPSVSAKVRSDIRYLLVDEYQDTNPVQDRILRRLAGVHGNLFVVGDDDQAIYRFRGAEVENITAFTARMPGAARVRLEINRRSTGALVGASSTLIAHNAHRVEKHLRSAKESGRPPQILRFDHLDAQATWVATRIAALKKDGAIGRYGECAILFRSIRASLGPFLEALERAGVPARILGGRTAFPSELLAELEDELRARAATCSREDGTTPWPSLLALYYEVLEESRRLSIFADDSLAMTELGRVGAIVGELDEGMSGADLQTRILELRSYLEGAQAWAEVEDDDALDAVFISTVHKAKGLEFEHVFVADLCEGKFPMLLPPGARDRLRGLFEGTGAEAEQAVAEERRIFYVAMTRAASALYLLADRANPSRFVAEVADACDEGGESVPESSIVSRGGRGVSPVPLTATPAQIHEYELCPHRYRLAQRHGFPSLTRGESPGRSSLRRALEILHRTAVETKSIRGDDLDRIFERSWLQTPDARERSREREQCRLIFKNYARGMLADRSARVVGVERPLRVSRGEDVLLGSLDLVQERAGTIEVVHFEYQRSAGREAYAHRLLELQRLAFAGRGVRMMLHYLTDDERDERFCREPEVVWAELAETYSAIRRREFEARPSAERCAACPMREVCIYRAGRETGGA